MLCCETIVPNHKEPSETEHQYTKIMQNAVLENCGAQLHRAKHNSA